MAAVLPMMEADEFEVNSSKLMAKHQMTSKYGMTSNLSENMLIPRVSLKRTQPSMTIISEPTLDHHQQFQRSLVQKSVSNPIKASNVMYQDSTRENAAIYASQMRKRGSQSSLNSYELKKASWDYGDLPKGDKELMHDPAGLRLSLLSTQSTKMDKRWNVFRSIPRNNDVFEPQWTLFCAQLLKAFMYVMLHVLLLGAGIMAKLIVLLMTSNMRPHGMFTPCRADGPNGRVWAKSPQMLPSNASAWFYWSLWLAFCVPELLTILRGFRIVCFKFVPNPTAFLLLFTIIVDVLHTIGVCLLVFYVLPELDAVRAAMVLCSIGFVPTLLSTLTRFRLGAEEDGAKPRWILCVLDCFACLLQATGLWLWPAFDTTMNPKIRWALPIALTLTSLGWWENYVSRNSSLNFLSWLGRIKDRIQRCRYKLCIVSSLIKCIISLFCMLIIGGATHSLKNIVNLSNPFEIYMNITSVEWIEHQKDNSQYANYVWMMCIGLILSSCLCYECAKFACKVKMDWFSYALPVASIAPMCIALLLASCEMRNRQVCYFSTWIPDKLFWNCGYGSNVIYDLLIHRYAWAWLLWIVSYIWIISHIFTQKIGRLNRTDTIFVTPMYQGLLVDHSLALNRRRMNVLRIKTEVLEDEMATEESTATESTDQSLAYSMTSLSLTNSNADTIPKIYICATMWHETNMEMTQMLKSILRMDEDQCARKNAQKYLKIVDPDYYELEAHIFFDDAWEVNEDTGSRVPNFYVRQFLSVIDAAASSVHKVEMILKPPVKIDVPYGGRLVWTLPGDNRLFVHLKDKTKIRSKKRWSQVMYMYYLLGHRIMELISDVQRKQLLADNTFLLAIDGDSKFDPSSVQKLVDLMKKRSRLGSSCGRIHPIGAGMMVLYQKFEYAIAHWFQKATEHVFGCVLCAPGCFSLFRGSALMDDNVMQKYTKLPSEPRHFVQYDQGEDRWLSTLLLKQGYRIEYAAAADAETYAPEGFDEFFNQRRRWTPSSIANTLDLLGDYKRAVQNNDSISKCFMFYQMIVIVFSLLGPGIIFTMMIYAQVAAFRIGSDKILIANLVPVVLYCILCFVGTSKVQLIFAKLLSVAYAFIMMAVLVGTGIQIATEGVRSPISLFVFSMSGIFCVAAFFHPKEFANIFNGAVFFLMIPCTYVLLSLYALINLNVINWGTREAAQKAVGGETTETVLHKWMKRISHSKRVHERTENNVANGRSAKVICSCAEWCQCMLCPEERERTEQFVWLGQRLEKLDRQLEQREVDSRCLVEDNCLSKDDIKPRASSTPEVLVTAPTPGRGSQALANRVKKPMVDSPSNPMSKKAKRDDNGASGDADSEPSDSSFGSIEVFDTDANGLLKPISYGSSSNTPKWMQLEYLRQCPYDILDEIENQFWVGLIEEHLKPLQKTPDEEIANAKGLLRLRNSVAFGLLLINCLLILVIYLLQLNKELLSIRWQPSYNYSYIDFDVETRKHIRVFGPLKIEPIGFTIILILSFILIIQTIGMIRHRWQTLQHILASTVLSCFLRHSRTGDHGQELVEENAVEIVKRLQKLGDDEHGEIGRSADNKKRKRRKIVFKLERARKRKQRVKGLHAAFQKRFFAFNPDKLRGSLRDIPLDKHNALFQSGSAKKAAAAEIKKRRDSALLQNDVDFESNPSAVSNRNRMTTFVQQHQKPADNLPSVRPTKLNFENVAGTSAEDSDQSDFERKMKLSMGQKNVSFVDDLNKILTERRGHFNV